MAWSDAARRAAALARKRRAAIPFGGNSGYTDPFTGKTRAPTLAESRRVHPSVVARDVRAMDREAAQTKKKLLAHPNYSKSDFEHLQKKGYSTHQILSIWDRDRAEGKGPVSHGKIPNVVGGMARFLTGRK